MVKYSSRNNLEKIDISITKDYKILNTFHATNDIKNIINETYNQEIFISWDKKRSYTKLWNSIDYSNLWSNRKIFDLELHKEYFT